MTNKIKEKIKKLPDEPGVYFFKHGKEILYIGKATSLRDRVRSYFSDNIEETRGPLISKMLSEFTDIKFQKTDSVLEALILEAHLIKKYQPPANVMEKDDKSFNYVVITKEDFPRILIMRGRELEKNNPTPTPARMPQAGRPPPKGGAKKDNSLKTPSLGEGVGGRVDAHLIKIFGPFTNGSQLKEAMKIVRKMFPYRDKCNPGGGYPCFNRQIGLCPGICTGEISKRDYAKQVKNIVLFFEGKKKQLVKNLEKEMKELAKKREFEKADKIKRQIFALGHIQDVSLIKSGNLSERPTPKQTFRIEGYDIAHLSGVNMVGAMTVVENGEVKKTDYRKFKIKGNTGADDTKALYEVLSRRLKHNEWPEPDLIVMDGGVAQKRAAEKALKENDRHVPVVSVVKDEKHRPREILGADHKSLIINHESGILLVNAEAHRFAIGFHRKLRKNF